MADKIEKKVREPLFHVSKRSTLPWYKAWGIRIIAVLLALIVCGVITVMLTNINPIEVYASMVKGAFGTSRRVWNLLQGIAMLLCISLAVTPAFKMRFWNIGAEGQVLIGGLASAACMILFGDKIPNVLLIAMMCVCSVLAVRYGQLSPLFLRQNGEQTNPLYAYDELCRHAACRFLYDLLGSTQGCRKIGIINQSSHAGWLPKIGEYDYLLNIISF